MYRRRLRLLMEAGQSPHKRGDVPSSGCYSSASSQISPQAWGCTAMAAIYDARRLRNLPTSVGMYRYSAISLAISIQSPHKRGDVPRQQSRHTYLFKKSPHKRGDVPRRCRHCGCSLKSPHKRGDVPLYVCRVCYRRSISPQAWGCTEVGGLFDIANSNLPTSVGMYRTIAAHDPCGCQSPHKRGDVPSYHAVVPHRCTISPQAWGCTAL